MSSQRFMSINLDDKKPAQPEESSQFELVIKNGKFLVRCRIGQDCYNILSTPDEGIARRTLDYCSARPERARYACRRLYLHGEEGDLEQFLSDAEHYRVGVRRHVRVIAELDVQMKGTDEEIDAYLRQKFQYAIFIRKVGHLKIEDVL